MGAEEIKPGIYWTGVNDYTKDLFEGIWPIPEGVSLNSFIVKGEKIALIDLVKSGGGGSSENLIDQLKSIHQFHANVLGLKVNKLSLLCLHG